MTFWIGLIVGAGFGALFCSLFYMLVIRWALTRKEDANKIFEKIQATNGDHIKRIADAIESHLKND